jgi:hypothetical protein
MKLPLLLTRKLKQFKCSEKFKKLRELYFENGGKKEAILNREWSLFLPLVIG